MLENGSITRREYRRAFADRDLGLEAGDALLANPRRAVLLQLRARAARRPLRRAARPVGRVYVYTTIDPRLQRLAEQAIRDTLYYPDDPASAVVSIDPRTGAIRAR